MSGSRRRMRSTRRGAPGERRASTWLRCDSVGRRKRSRRAAVEPAAMTAIATAAVSVIGSHGVPSDGSGDFGT